MMMKKEQLETTYGRVGNCAKQKRERERKWTLLLPPALVSGVVLLFDRLHFVRLVLPPSVRREVKGLSELLLRHFFLIGPGVTLLLQHEETGHP